MSRGPMQAPSWAAAPRGELVTVARNLSTRYLAITVETVIGLVMLPLARRSRRHRAVRDEAHLFRHASSCSAAGDRRQRAVPGAVRGRVGRDSGAGYTAKLKELAGYRRQLASAA